MLNLLDKESYYLDERSYKLRKSIFVKKANIYQVIVENPFKIEKDVVEKLIECRLNIYQDVLKEQLDVIGMLKNKKNKEQSKVVVEEELIKHMVFMGSIIGYV